MIARLCLLLVPMLLPAQPAFEAASVKPADPNANGFYTGWSRTQVEYRNCSLLQCIQTAWGLPEYAVSGPSWLDAVRFDVIAKLPQGATARDAGPMLQALLAERFDLKTHMETRSLPGYALAVAKGGPKLPVPSADDHGGTSSGPSLTRCKVCTMQEFIAQLTRSIGRPVVDETALAGTYNFDLRWAQETPPAADSISDPAPSLVTAIQQQLGLKLEARKLSTSVLVVDGASRVPSGN